MGSSGFFPSGHPSQQGNHGQGWVNPNWSLNNNLPKPRVPTRSFLQAPPSPQPFIVHGHCFGMPYFYHDARPITPPVDVHVTRSHHPPVHVPPHPQLSDRILKQIEYYFSHENLIKDIYLRGKMDDEGWVSINLIAGFKKVKELTDNIHIILDSLKHSAVVQVKGDKIRRRNDWKKWLLPHYFDVTSLSRSVSSDRVLSEDHQHSPSGKEC